MLCISSGDGFFKWLNPAFADTLGWTIEELLTRPYVDFVHPDDLAATIREVERQVKAGKSVFHFENRYRHKDGSWRVLSWKSVPHGELMYAVARDVTQRNELEAALKETNSELERRVAARTAALSTEVAERRKAEQKFRGLLEAAPDAMIIIDQNGRIVLASKRVEAMFGYTSAEAVGAAIDTLLPGLSWNVAVATGIRAPDTFDVAKTAPGGDRFGRRKDGSLFPVEINLSPDHLDEGPVAIAAVRDITERRSVEMQLRQSQKMEAIGNLTGGMAHDFNNLLAIVIGNLDLLASSRKEDAEIKRLGGEALEAALRGADLTQRLLAFARRQPLQPKRIDINQQIANIAKLLRRTLSANISTSLNLNPETWPVIVDPAQLDSSITNLANNARDAMPMGGNLNIATGNQHLDADYAAVHADVTPGDYAMIEVSDTGAGMTPEVVSRIFEPFFSTKEKEKGTGLGLSMVFGFIKQSGGHISVYSEEGLGTAFRLFFPRARDEGAQTVEAASPTVTSAKGERILVVEDDAALRRVVVRQLTELGYSVTQAEDASSALKVLEAEPVDLLFTDVVMPGGSSGYDLTEMAIKRWPSLKVLMTSGFPDAMQSAIGVSNRGTRLLSKPYRKDDLARTLREVLRGDESTKANDPS